MILLGLLIGLGILFLGGWLLYIALLNDLSVLATMPIFGSFFRTSKWIMIFFGVVLVLFGIEILKLTFKK